MNSLRHETERRFGGSKMRILPLSPMRPSGIMIFQSDPTFQSETWCVPAQYWRVNSGSMSAVQSFSGVVRM